MTTALLRVLARTRDRAFASIEEALLLRALVAEHGLSRHRSGATERSRRGAGSAGGCNCCRDCLMRRWRRCAAVICSSWVANRVIVPLARANPEHAGAAAGDAVCDIAAVDAGVAVAGSSTTSRPCGPRAEHMVNRPRLFIDTLQANDGEARAGRPPACRPRRRMHRRFALPGGGDRAAAQACRHAAPTAGAGWSRRHRACARRSTP